MTYQHKTAMASLIATVLVYTIYTLTVLPMYFSGGFDGAEGARALGWAVLTVIGVAIVANILATILFSILHAIVTREPKPSFVVDERDRLFEMQGLRAFLYSGGLGFLLAMIFLSQGATFFVVIHLILFGFATGDVLSNVMRHKLYRQGE